MKKSFAFFVCILIFACARGQGQFSFNYGIPFQFLNEERRVNFNLGLKCQEMYFFKIEQSSIFLVADVHDFHRNYSSLETSSGGYPVYVDKDYNQWTLSGFLGIGVHLQNAKHPKRFVNIGFGLPSAVLTIKNGTQVTRTPYNVLDTANKYWVTNKITEENFRNKAEIGMIIFPNLFLEYGAHFKVSNKKNMSLKLGANIGTVYALIGFEKLSL